MTPYYDEGGITIYCGDCREILPELAFDAVVTDPPYGTKLYAADTDVSDILVPLLAGRAAVFGYPERLVRLAMKAAAVPSEWIVWWPTNGACRGFNLSGARNESEHIAIFGKHRIALLREPRAESAKRFHAAGYQQRADSTGKNIGHGSRDVRRVGDVWRYPAPGLAFNAKRRKHPNEKPEALMLRLVEGMAAAGETILDPFVGSGPTLAAARQLGVRAIGIDIDERHCATAVARLAQQQLTA